MVHASRNVLSQQKQMIKAKQWAGMTHIEYAITNLVPILTTRFLH